MKKNAPSPLLQRAALRNAIFLFVLGSVAGGALLLPFDLHVEHSRFELLHQLLESIGIFLALLIFFLGLIPLEGRRTSRSALFTGTFLCVAMMEMAHILTYGFSATSVNEAPAPLSMHFAVASQCFASLAMVIAIFGVTRPITLPRAYAISGGFFVVALVALFVIPTLTPLIERASPSAVSASHSAFQVIRAGGLVAIGIVLWRRDLSRQPLAFSVSSASFLLAMSAILFAVTQHEIDLSGLLEHLYKLAAYALLLRVAMMTLVQMPFIEINQLNDRYESTLHALPDQVFEVGEDGVVLQHHAGSAVIPFGDANANLVGKPLSAFLPPAALSAWQQSVEACRSAGKSYGLQFSLMTNEGERRFEISGSTLSLRKKKKHFILIVRDISERYALVQRLEALLALTKNSAALNEQEIARAGLDALEALTHSKIGFLHFLSEDEREIELFAWSTATEAHYCNAKFDEHYPLRSAGLWADCVRTRAPVVINDYASAPGKHGLPEGHSPLQRLISVPVFDGTRVAMIVGVGNAETPYNDTSIGVVELFASELYQIIQRQRANRQLEKTRVMMASALENLPVGIAILRMQGELRFEYFNERFPAIYEVDPAAITTLESFVTAAFETAEERNSLLEPMGADVDSGDPQRYHWERLPIRRHGKPTRYVNVKLAPIPRTDLAVIQVEDVTDEMRNEEQDRIAAAAFSSQEGIIITDAHSRILRVNSAFERQSGYSAEELIGKTPAILSSGAQDEAFYKALWRSLREQGVWRGEISNKTKSGVTVPMSLTVSAVRDRDGNITHYVGDYLDLSLLKTAEETITRLSYFDTLTGLPNRENLKSALTARLINTEAPCYSGALMIDLDNFKIINETLGHTAGDMLLLQIAKRIQASVREGDTVARYGGDEFVVLLNRLGPSPEEASLKIQLVAQAILGTLDDTYFVEERPYFSTCSIGATLIEPGTSDMQEIFKQLDIALSEAKTEGRNQLRFFDSGLQESLNRQAQMQHELRVALQEHQFELYYQPQLNIVGEMVGAEGLLRWNHPTRGLLSPKDFLPLAEESQLMIEIGDEVLALGMAQPHAWQQKPHTKHLKLSLNITVDQFYEEQFETDLKALLKQHEISPRSLMLEFTESMLLGDVALAREKIGRLNEADLEFAIDDFGTGYSSLSYLSTLPMNQLKIDQSFVRNIGKVDTDGMIVRTIIDMAHALKMEVIAEGVETEVQHRYLLEQGCGMFQGFLFSKPLPIAQFARYAKSHSPH